MENRSLENMNENFSALKALILIQLNLFCAWFSFVLCHSWEVWQGRWAWVCIAFWRLPCSSGCTDCVPNLRVSAELNWRCKQKGYPGFLRPVCFGISVLEMKLVALGQRYMPNSDYRCVWKFTQGRDDLNSNTPMVASFSRLRSGSGGFSCSPVLSFCWNESNHLLFLYYGRTWHSNTPLPVQLGRALQHSQGIYS